jgi:hypothetical protein
MLCGRAMWTIMQVRPGCTYACLSRHMHVPAATRRQIDLVRAAREPENMYAAGYTYTLKRTVLSSNAHRALTVRAHGQQSRGPTREPLGHCDQQKDVHANPHRNDGTPRTTLSVGSSIVYTDTRYIHRPAHSSGRSRPRENVGIGAYATTGSGATHTLLACRARALQCRRVRALHLHWQVDGRAGVDCG